MVLFIIGLIFSGIALVAVGLLRTYYRVPIKELKRRARSGDQLADFLYKPVSYGLSLRMVLWGLMIIFASLAFVCFAKATAGWLAFLLIAFFMWLGFLWLPSGRLTDAGSFLARILTPAVTWLVRVTYPLTDRIVAYLNRQRPLKMHTGMYQKEDLVELLDVQRKQADSRFSAQEIDLAIHALSFGDKLVSDVMVPRREVRFVQPGETVGPLLMDELHSSGFSRFPVITTSDEQENVVGTLFMKDLVGKKSGGKIEAIMRPDVYYVNEDFTLFAALNAFLKTKHHLFVVVNGFEEIVGVITIEDIIEQVIGKPIMDEFDKYENLREVAARAAKNDYSRRSADGQAVDKLTDKAVKKQK